MPTHEASLWMICLQAFAAVLLVLSFLAALMRLLIMAFPEAKKKTGPDAAIAAAISQAVQATCPGAVVTRIEEIR
ncbi:MAG: hypothetical protein H7A43_12245 [Verrucomicrobia bacterium]|nr:hypothetical protein [Kiritimatiellia bacterium]MCP5489406.1 hypothetical protein [Verrucomicrobiota bacterium]